MFSPMTPMTERVRQENERRLARANSGPYWNLAAAFRKVLNVRQQRPASPEAAPQPAHSAGEQATMTA